MKISRKEKKAIRAHWAYLDLRFLRDGTVLARRPNERGAWGRLYSPRETAAHIQHIQSMK